jgi:rubrerythrin
MLPPLKITPPGEVTSAEHLMAIAHALEREAARRYRELAARMHSQGEAALAALFAFLAEIEDKHVAQVEARATEITGHMPDAAQMAWDVPENFDEEEARSAALSPYRALAIAVRNEERTFVFYSYVAASAATPALQRLAEQFALEELGHASLLRRERRKAWPGRNVSSPPHVSRPPESVEQLMTMAAQAERSASAAHRALATRMAALEGPAVAALFDYAADEEDKVDRALTARLPHATTLPLQSMRARSVRDGLQILEDAFERYADIAEKATDEATLLEAQSLAELALRRLAYVHGALGAGTLARHPDPGVQAPRAP